MKIATSNSRLNIFRAERTTAKKFAVMTLLGLMFVPAILATSFTWTQTEATQNLDRLSAAVVNLDKPVTVDGQYVPLGRVLVAKLTDTDGDEAPVNIHWVLTDEETASQGLDSGSFSTVVTIPEEFSAAATSVGTSMKEQDPSLARQATLDIRTSQSAGIIDPTIGQAVAAAITNALNTQLTETFVENIFIGFSEQKDKLGQAADGAAQLADGADQLTGGLDKAADGSEKLVGGLGRLADGADKLAGGTHQLANGAGRLANGTDRLAGGADQLAGGINQLAGGLNGAKGQIDQLVKVLEQAAAATKGSRDELKNIQAQIAALNNQLAEALKACGQNPALDALCAALQPIATLIAQLQAQVGQVPLLQILDQLLAVLDDLPKYTSQLNQLFDGVNRLADGASRLAGGVRDLAGGAHQLANGADRLAGGADRLADGAATAADQAGMLPGGLHKLAGGAAQLADGAGELAGGLADGVAQIPSYSDDESAELAGVVAAPVASQDIPLPDASVSAGYFTAVALAISGLVLFMLLRAVPRRAMTSRSNALMLTLQAYWPAAVIVLLQTVVVAIGLQFPLHLGFGKLMAFAGVVLLAGLVITGLNQAMVATLGGAGRFVGLFAIAVSAPAALISTTPGPLQTLIDLTPLSPTISALRGVITGDNIGGEVAALCVWGVAGILVTVLAISKERSVSAKALATVA